MTYKLSDVFKQLAGVVGDTCPHCGKPYSLSYTTGDTEDRVGIHHMCMLWVRYDVDYKASFEKGSIENDLS